MSVALYREHKVRPVLPPADEGNQERERRGMASSEREKIEYVNESGQVHAQVNSKVPK